MESNNIKGNIYIKKPIPITAIILDKDSEVKTMEGTLKGKKGDYLVTGIKGEKYPVDKEIFEKTYKIFKGKKKEADMFVISYLRQFKEKLETKLENYSHLKVINKFKENFVEVRDQYNKLIIRFSLNGQERDDCRHYYFNFKTGELDLYYIKLIKKTIKLAKKYNKESDEGKNEAFG